MNNSDRRRARRVQTIPRHVRLTARCNGFLVDLSELGALVQLSEPPRNRCILHVEWSPTETLYFRSQVAWSTPIRIGSAIDDTPRWHLVGLEFREVGSATAQRLRGLMATEAAAI
jgi:hypothetical protein